MLPTTTKHLDRADLQPFVTVGDSCVTTVAVAKNLGKTKQQQQQQQQKPALKNLIKS